MAESNARPNNRTALFNLDTISTKDLRQSHLIFQFSINSYGSKKLVISERSKKDSNDVNIIQTICVKRTNHAVICSHPISNETSNSEDELRSLIKGQPNSSNESNDSNAYDRIKLYIEHTLSTRDLGGRFGNDNCDHYHIKLADLVHTIVYQATRYGCSKFLCNLMQNIAPYIITERYSSDDLDQNQCSQAAIIEPFNLRRGGIRIYPNIEGNDCNMMVCYVEHQPKRSGTHSPAYSKFIQWIETESNAIIKPFADDCDLPENCYLINLSNISLKIKSLFIEGEVNADNALYDNEKRILSDLSEKVDSFVVTEDGKKDMTIATTQMKQGRFTKILAELLLHRSKDGACETEGSAATLLDAAKEGALLQEKEAIVHSV